MKALTLIRERVTLVIEGCAQGVDRFAEMAAKTLDLKVNHVPVTPEDRRRYRVKRAPIMRNLRMLDMKPDMVLAFHKGLSPGTLHCITEARRRGIPVYVYTGENGDDFYAGIAARAASIEINA